MAKMGIHLFGVRELTSTGFTITLPYKGYEISITNGVPPPKFYPAEVCVFDPDIETGKVLYQCAGTSGEDVRKAMKFINRLVKGKRS